MQGYKVFVDGAEAAMVYVDNPTGLWDGSFHVDGGDPILLGSAPITLCGRADGDRSRCVKNVLFGKQAIQLQSLNPQAWLVRSMKVFQCWQRGASLSESWILAEVCHGRLCLPRLSNLDSWTSTEQRVNLEGYFVMTVMSTAYLLKSSGVGRKAHQGSGPHDLSPLPYLVGIVRNQARIWHTQCYQKCSVMNMVLCSRFFDGRITQLSIFDQPLTDSNVASLYRAATGALPTGQNHYNPAPSSTPVLDIVPSPETPIAAAAPEITPAAKAPFGYVTGTCLGLWLFAVVWE